MNAIIAELESDDIFAVEDMPSAQQEIADYMAGRHQGAERFVGEPKAADPKDDESSGTRV